LNGRRRLVLMAAGAVAVATVRLGAHAQPGHKVSAAQLQQVLAERFPLRYAVAGMLQLEVRTPLLRFLPEQNRLGSELAIEAAGQALRRPHTGAVELDFALRYEATDRTLRAHQIRVHAVRLPSLSRDAAALIDAYARASAERALLEVVLHTLAPRDLALADTMGLEPSTITVVADGLVVGFAPRQR
jgi:hypothetical protein